MALEQLDFVSIRPTERRRAVRLTPRNAQAVADAFGGSVQVVRGFGDVSITRLTLGSTSGPAAGWITANGVWLPDDDGWEQADD